MLCVGAVMLCLYSAMERVELGCAREKVTVAGGLGLCNVSCDE